MKRKEEFKEWISYIQVLKQQEKLKELRKNQQDLITDMTSGKIKPKYNELGNYVKDINTLQSIS